MLILAGFWLLGPVDARVPDVDRAAAEAGVGLIPVGDLGL